MASKGQKFKKYDPLLKKEILDKYLSGNGTYGSLSNEYKISADTIKTWVLKSKKGIDITVDHRPGNAKKKTQEDYKEKYEILKNYQAFLKAQREKK